MNADPEDTAAEAAAATGATDDPGLAGLIADVRRLADDARTLAQAELAYQASRAAVAGAAARSIVLYGAIAATLAVFALVALTVGLLLALVPLVSAWGATAIVAGGLGGIAFICVKLASRRWQRAKAAIVDRSANEEPQ